MWDEFGTDISEPKSGQWDAGEACLHGRAQVVSLQHAAKESAPTLPALLSREDYIQDSGALEVVLWNMVERLCIQR